MKFLRKCAPVIGLVFVCCAIAYVFAGGAPGYTPPPPSSLPPSGSAGGDLTGTYPNPTIKASVSLTTPNVGAATGTSLALGGATLGGNVFAATGHVLIEGVTSTGATGTGAFVFGTTPTINGDSISATIQHLTENTQTGAGYTLVLGDDYKVITVNTAGANTLSIPTNASVAFPVGTQITVIQKGAGQWTISATTPGTTTIVSNGGTAASPKLRAQYSACTLWKDATDHWYVFGDIQ